MQEDLIQYNTSIGELEDGKSDMMSNYSRSSIKKSSHFRSTIQNEGDKSHASISKLDEFYERIKQQKANKSSDVLGSKTRGFTDRKEAALKMGKGNENIFKKPPLQYQSTGKK